MITLFATPKPFRGHIDVIQRNALQSWKRLHPDVEIILFGNDDGAGEICREFGLRHEPRLLLSTTGAKRIDFLFGRAQEIARHDIVCYCNCDIILTREFRLAVERLLAWRRRFLMVGCRWDVDIVDPLDFLQPDWEERVVARAQSEGFRRFYYNVDYFVFPRGLYTDIPPLVLGRIWWDHWVVWKAHASGAAVVDVSEAVCAVHQNHNYDYHPQGKKGVWHDQEAKRNLELAGAWRRMRTIEDAEFRLTARGIRRQYFHWLAPAKRHGRNAWRPVRNFARTRVWHPFLDATRRLRHALGLKQTSLAFLFRRRSRRHPDDDF